MKERENINKKPLIILTGPTAVGKTQLSLRLAHDIGCEIISADSMQVYRRMDIGSAKILPEQRQGIRHHLIDCREPEEDFHVAEFQRAAKQAMEMIYAAGKIPLIVGGTGFYIQALLRDIDFSEGDMDQAYRSELEALAREKGTEQLHEMLRRVDPKSAEAIHPNNVKRVIRALEYFRETKEPISLHNEEQREKSSPYNFAYFVLDLPRELLYERIDARVDEMLRDGLEQEVRALWQSGCHRGMVSMQGLGYKEMLAYLEGELTLEQAVYLIKRDTRHFAKRQLTWFKREEQVIRLRKDEYVDEDELLAAMIKILREKGIISI